MGTKSPTEFAGRVNGAIFSIGGTTADLDDGERLIIGEVERDAPYPLRFIDAVLVMTGAGISSGSLKIQKGDGEQDETWTDITDAMDTTSKISNDVLRPGSITYTNTLVPKYGSLGVLAVGDNHAFRIEVIVRREDA